MMAGCYILKSKDPFEQLREIHREEVRRLKDEIMRLKRKCDEGYTEAELFGDAYRPAAIFESAESARRHGFGD